MQNLTKLLFRGVFPQKDKSLLGYVLKIIGHAYSIQVKTKIMECKVPAERGDVKHQVAWGREGGW